MSLSEVNQLKRLEDWGMTIVTAKQAISFGLEVSSCLTIPVPKSKQVYINLEVLRSLSSASSQKNLIAKSFTKIANAIADSSNPNLVPEKVKPIFSKLVAEGLMAPSPNCREKFSSKIASSGARIPLPVDHTPRAKQMAGWLVDMSNLNPESQENESLRTSKRLRYSLDEI
eukprot:COSAG01_NODE_128_length_24936_cov_324.347264_14_plen_171_part_00